MESKVLEFITKIYVEGKSSKPILNKLAKGVLITYAILFLFITFFDEFSISMITTNLMPLLLISYVMNATRPIKGYKTTIAKVELNDNSIIIAYEGIDRADKIGPRVEKTEIEHSHISKIEYSEPLKCLNIQGMPIETTEYLKKHIKKEYIKNYVDKKEEKRTLLYVSGKEKEEIVKFIESKTGLVVANLD